MTRHHNSAKDCSASAEHAPSSFNERSADQVNTARQTTGGVTGWLKRLWPLIALLGATVIVFAMGWHRYFTVTALAENRDALRNFIDAHWLLSLAAFVALYAAVVALSLPGGAVMTIAGGFLFGWLLGGAASVVGATIGATIVFHIAKSTLGRLLAQRAGPFLSRFRQGFQEDAFSYLLFLRLVPIFPFWLGHLAPGLLSVPFATYAP